MKNLRRLALVAGVALSAVAFSPKAQAQTANVDFTGTVPPFCALGTTPGTLALVTPNNLATNIPGNINVTCNGGTTFTITDVTDNGSVIPGGSYTTDIDLTSAIIRDGITEVARGDVSPRGLGVSNPPGTAGPVQGGFIVGKNYTVNLTVSNLSPSPLKRGDYAVRVGVLLTPQ